MENSNLKKKIEELDQVPIETPWSQDDLWKSIEAELEKPVGIRTIKLKIGRHIPWAAILIFAFGLSFLFFLNRSTKDGQITISQTQTAITPTWEEDKELDEGKAFIHHTCNKQLEICKTPEFKGLYAELLQVEEEKLELLQLIYQYGNDEISTKALIQLENTESSITSELISMILT